jgi:hypothetical protein
MEPEAGVFVLVEGGAIEPAQPVSIGREVTGNPVDEDGDVGPMQGIDEQLEVLGRAEAAGRSEVTGRLVAPGSVKRELGDGHELQMRKAHVVHVLDEHLGQFGVGVIAPFVPGAFPAA